MQIGWPKTGWILLKPFASCLANERALWIRVCPNEACGTDREPHFEIWSVEPRFDLGWIKSNRALTLNLRLDWFCELVGSWCVYAFMHFRSFGRVQKSERDSIGCWRNGDFFDGSIGKQNRKGKHKDMRDFWIQEKVQDDDFGIKKRRIAQMLERSQSLPQYCNVVQLARLVFYKTIDDAVQGTSSTCHRGAAMECHGSNTSAKNKLVGPSTSVVFGVQRKCNAAMRVVWLERLAQEKRRIVDVHADGRARDPSVRRTHTEGERRIFKPFVCGHRQSDALSLSAGWTCTRRGYVTPSEAVCGAAWTLYGECVWGRRRSPSFTRGKSLQVDNGPRPKNPCKQRERQRDGEEAKSARDNNSQHGEEQQLLSRVVVTLYEWSDLHCRSCLECETRSSRHVADGGWSKERERR